MGIWTPRLLMYSAQTWKGTYAFLGAINKEETKLNAPPVLERQGQRRLKGFCATDQCSQVAARMRPTSRRSGMYTRAILGIFQPYSRARGQHSMLSYGKGTV